MELKFQENFLWGAATSGPQTEGRFKKQHDNVFDYVNEKAVDFYNAVINEFIAQGIRPMINLNHFDLPVELLKTYGGWESPHVVDLYAGFAAKCFAEFSDRVSDWFTFNEPMVVVECAYLLGFH